MRSTDAAVAVTAATDANGDVRVGGHLGVLRPRYAGPGGELAHDGVIFRRIALVHLDRVVHALDIFGRCLSTDEQHVLACFRSPGRLLGAEGKCAACSAW